MDGRCTAHGTITAVYHKTDDVSERTAPGLTKEEAEGSSVDPYHVSILICAKPYPAQKRREITFSTNSCVL